jgi:hypothetical protein
MDVNEREKVARLASDTLGPILPGKKSERIIDAKHEFVKKRFDGRYLWKPSPRIESIIAAAIFNNAVIHKA